MEQDHKSKTNIQEYNPLPLLHQPVHGWIFSQAATNTEKATLDGVKKIPNQMNDDTRKLKLGHDDAAAKGI